MYLRVSRVYEVEAGGVITTAATTSIPLDGDSQAVESVADFSPEGGQAVYEPGTAREELVEYTTIDEDTDEIVGVTRGVAPFTHATGTVIRSGSDVSISRWADGTLDEDDAPIVGVFIPRHLAPFYVIGGRLEADKEVAPVEIDDDGSAVITDAPVDAPTTLNVDVQAAEDFVFTSETRTTSTYGDLATVGPTVWVRAPAGGRVLVVNTARISNTTAAAAGFMSYIIYHVIAEDSETAGPEGLVQDTTDNSACSNGNDDQVTTSRTNIIVGLTPGNWYRVRAKYRGNTSATSTFVDRHLAVVPL